MPRRLLLLNTDLERGGTPTVVRELAKRLHDPPRVYVEVACLAQWGPIADEIKQAGINVTAFGAQRPIDLWVIKHLVNLIHHRRIDTIYSFLLHANAIAAAAKAACPGVRFFQSIQTTQPNPAWHWHVQRLVHRAAEKIIVPSGSVAQVAQSCANVPSSKIVIIPNAIDPADFTPSRIPASNPRPYPIGFLGRLDPVKRIPDLIAAVALLGDLVHLHIFGDGPERPSIERAIQSHNLQSRVTLHGSVPRPQDALSQIGLLVLPSINEGMPMVLIEAMASGVPVIGRNVPGVNDLIVSEETGLLVDSLEVPPFAAAIERLVTDAQLRRRLIDKARRSVAERFPWNVVLDRYRVLLAL